MQIKRCQSAFSSKGVEVNLYLAFLSKIFANNLQINKASVDYHFFYDIIYLVDPTIIPNTLIFQPRIKDDSISFSTCRKLLFAA